MATFSLFRRCSMKIALDDIKALPKELSYTE
jgi:hypothetical protein